MTAILIYLVIFIVVTAFFMWLFAVFNGDRMLNFFDCAAIGLIWPIIIVVVAFFLFRGYKKKQYTD